MARPDRAVRLQVLLKRYSPECVEEKFCELRIDGVLRNSAIIRNQDVGKGPSRVQPFCVLRLGVYF
jgi:hypothetical protein